MISQLDMVPSDVIDVPSGTVSAVVLGVMQDAGLPNAGCRCSRCASAFRDPASIEYAACLAIIDTRGQPAAVWVVDATPDIKFQLNMLAGLLGRRSEMPDRIGQPAGLFLTHAHMGHTLGLAHLGPEAMNVRNLPVYASAGLVDVLNNTHLWRPLVRGNLELISLAPNRPVALAVDLNIIPIPVPHRDELEAGTFGYRIGGPTNSMLYLPDIDGWAQWPEARNILANVDIALVDACFFSQDEISGRSEVAHPLVPDTLDFFAEMSTRLILTHFNHTNPVLDTDSQEAATVAASGAQVASTGLILNL
jgi:pyrroloquinoline quinone biosynthesis protein B